MARNPPLWGLGVSAGFHQSLGEEIPSAGAWECDWSRLRYQKPRSCRGTGWDTLEPLTLHCLLLAGERDSGSCLSVHPSELQPWLIQTHLKGHFLHSPSSLPRSPQSRDSKGGSRVFDQRKRLFCCFGNTRNSLLWLFLSFACWRSSTSLGLRTGKWVWMCMFIKYLITACRLCHYLSIGEGLKAWAGLFYMARILISLSGLLPSAIPKQFLMPTCLIHSNSRLWSLCPKKRKHFQSKITKVYWSHSYSQWQISKHPSFCLLPFPSSSLHGFFPLKKINFHF